MSIKSILIIGIIVIGMAFKSSGQTVYDMKVAQAIALAGNKMIIVDFWAAWCIPCLKMNSELWESEAFAKMHKQFVLLKIDISKNRSLANEYDVKTIPRVLVITANKDKLADEKGYGSPYKYLKLFEAFPESYSS